MRIISRALPILLVCLASQITYAGSTSQTITFIGRIVEGDCDFTINPSANQQGQVQVQVNKCGTPGQIQASTGETNIVISEVKDAKNRKVYIKATEHYLPNRGQPQLFNINFPKNNKEENMITVNYY